MNSLAYLTCVPLTSGGGGVQAVNYQVHAQLRKYFEVPPTTPIPYRSDFLPRLTSKFRRRILGQPGKFALFSQKRLDANAQEATKRVPPETDAIFFKGTTPWGSWKSERPYFCYTDVAFHTFFHNTFDPANFSSADIERIWDRERSFMKAAKAVFFESDWGAQMTRNSYALDGENFFAVGRGGNIPLPQSDRWNRQSLRLLTVAKHFHQKGGDLVRTAFDQLKPRYPDLTWHIVGGRPDFEWNAVDGVTWEGFLDTGKPEERDRITRLYENAFLLLHPTREDTNPLVITEAAGFGCPAVSVRNFAIPELVLDGETGILVDPPATPVSLVHAVEDLIENPERYLAMRNAARRHAQAHSSWDRIGRRISDVIHSHLS